MGEAMKRLGWIGLVAPLVALSLIAMACGGEDEEPSNAGGSGPQETTSVTLYLDFAFDGLHAPFFVAQEKGYFEEEGLEVEIRPGQGSSDSVRVTGAGQAEFGFSDAATMSSGVSEGAPVTMVAVVLRDNPMVALTLKDSGIEEPQDLEGKSIGDAQESSTAALLPAFLAANGLGMSDVKFIGMSFPSRVPALLNGRVNAILGFIQEFVNIQDKVNFIRWADSGIDAYSSGLIVNNDFMEGNPEVVEGFVNASIKGLQSTIDNPEEAAQIVAEAAESDPEYFAGELELLDPYLEDQEVEANGLGWMSEERWSSTQELMLQYGGQEEELPLDQLYTNEFLP
jgi:NitT/TauT family transport system substrate-binding protein